MKPLPASFFARSADVVAEALIGTRLVRNELVARLVETEAYLGPHDLACHSAKGRTKRTEVMFGPPGFAYVYLIYGRYDMLNVVTGAGTGEAVLVRAAEPLSGWPEGTRLEIRAPLVQERKGEFKDLFESARKQGFVRAVVDGELIELADPPKLNRRLNHSVSVVVDRLVVRTEDRGRITDSVETALRLAEGLAEVVRYDGSEPVTELFSERYGCAACGISIATTSCRVRMYSAAAASTRRAIRPRRI